MKLLNNKKIMWAIVGVACLILLSTIVIICVSGTRASKATRDEDGMLTQTNDDAEETSDMEVHSSPEVSDEDSVKAPASWGGSASNDTTGSGEQESAEGSATSGNTEDGENESDAEGLGLSVEDTPDEEGRTYADPL